MVDALGVLGADFNESQIEFLQKIAHYDLDPAIRKYAQRLLDAGKGPYFQIELETAQEIVGGKGIPGLRLDEHYATAVPAIRAAFARNQGFTPEQQWILDYLRTRSKDRDSQFGEDYFIGKAALEILLRQDPSRYRQYIAHLEPWLQTHNDALEIQGVLMSIPATSENQPIRKAMLRHALSPNAGTRHRILEKAFVPFQPLTSDEDYATLEKMVSANPEDVFDQERNLLAKILLENYPDQMKRRPDLLQKLGK